MTFEAGGSWLAVKVEQVDRVAVAAHLWPVPFARPQHLGLLDGGQELIPVLGIDEDPPSVADGSERLVAILHVRGESVGLAIDRAGRICDRYRIEDTRAVAPPALAAAGARPAASSDSRFWLVDADRLFDWSGAGA